MGTTYISHLHTYTYNMNSLLILSCVFGLALARPQEIFSYSADSHAQSASGDAGNAVEGSYSYTAPNGDEIVVTYTADAENGYVAKSSALPVAPEVPAFEFDPAVLPVAPEVPAFEFDPVVLPVAPEVPAYEAPALPVAPKVAEVAPLEAPKAYTFVGPHTIAAPAAVAHHVPAYVPALAYNHVLPAAPAYYPYNLGYSYLPYGPHPYLIKVADKPAEE